MTTAELLTRVLEAGGEIIPDPEHPRLRVPRELRPIVEAHRTDLRVLVCESFALAAAYRAYWSLAESEPLEMFRAARSGIARLETHAPPEVAWRILRETAIAYHAETGVCPFCREQGPLHLPAEQISMELLSGAVAHGSGNDETD